MANLEKHPKKTLEQAEEADYNGAPTRARTPRLLGRYIKNRRHYGGGKAKEARTGEVILRIEDLPATPRNREVMRKRVRSINQQLEATGAPFRLRVR